MYKIGILSKEGRSLTITRAEIAKSPFFEPLIYVNSLKFVKALKQNALQALVILTEEFRPNHINIMRQVKTHFPNTPIVIVTEKFDQKYKIQLVDFKKTILINFKYELQDLNGILLKLINNLHVIPRLASRFPAAQMARVQIDRDKVHSAWVLNLAQDGACFRVFNKRLHLGDKIRIEIPLPDLKKTHIIQGKIVWEKLEKLKNDVTSNSQMVGIQFVS
jgi:hypothetical protein